MKMPRLDLFCIFQMIFLDGKMGIICRGKSTGADKTERCAKLFEGAPHATSQKNFTLESRNFYLSQSNQHLRTESTSLLAFPRERWQDGGGRRIKDRHPALIITPRLPSTLFQPFEKNRVAPGLGAVLSRLILGQMMVRSHPDSVFLTLAR